MQRAKELNMSSIAITDHGVVQAFPEAHKLLGSNNPDMKVIYGVEAYLCPDKTPIVTRSKGQDIDTTYCVLDLETTGLSFRTDKITDAGSVSEGYCKSTSAFTKIYLFNDAKSHATCCYCRV